MPVACRRSVRAARGWLSDPLAPGSPHGYLRRRDWWIARDEYALSAMTASGLRRGRPAPDRGTLKASMTSSKTVESLTSPGVTTTARGSPRPSQARWTLVVNPPRDRPSAWPVVASAGSSSPSHAAAPFCVLGVLVGSVDRGVDRHRPLHGSDGVVPDLDLLQQAGPGAVRLITGAIATLLALAAASAARDRTHDRRSHPGA